MPLKKSDFIEIEFTGKIKDGDIFDSNIKEDLAKLNPKAEVKPFIFCIGQGMFLKGVEDFLIGKGIGEYKIELAPENAFGKRNPQLIQRMSIKIFHEQKLNPLPGIPFNFDGRIGKVLTVSGGRVMVDFNSPLAGKDIIYEIKILRKVDDLNEKTKALIDFLFRKDFKFEIRQEAKPLASSPTSSQTKEKTLILYVDSKMAKFVELFKDKFKEILDLDLKVEEEKEEEKKEDKEEKAEEKIESTT